MRLSRPTRAMPWLLTLLVALAGCAPPVTIRPPTSAEIDQVRANRLAVVLFQLAASIDGKPVSALAPGDSNNAVRIYLARLDQQSPPERVTPNMPSERAAAEGRHYLMLPPGVYYLLVLPPGVEQNPPAVAYAARSGRYGRLTRYAFEPGRGGFWAPELMSFVFAGTPPADFSELQGFWFEVPEGRPVVYLGSLSVRCTSGRGLFGSLIDNCADFVLRNDIEAAERVAAASLPGFAMEALPLVPYGKPRVGTRLQDLGATVVVANPPAQMAAAFTGAELGPWGVIPGSGRELAVYNLLAIALESAERIIAEKHASEYLIAAQPCIDRLSAAVADTDYASMLVPELGKAARTLGVALELDDGRRPTGLGWQSHAVHRLTTSLPVLRLREVDTPRQLALELALEVRIEPIQSGAVRYYGMLYYAPELSLSNPLVPRSPLYARFVSQRAKSRPESEWCGPRGPELLAQEISLALSRIARQLAQDLH